MPMTTTSASFSSRHGFDALLDDWTSSEEAKSCKPDRLIYEHALGLSGARAEETLFVGDSLEHDIAGAHAVGMRTALIGDPGTVAPLSHGLDAPVDADFTLRDLVEVLAIVDRLNGSLAIAGQGARAPGPGRQGARARAPGRQGARATMGR